ncbi:MAG: hypothetical protein JXA03_05135 [Bacteroidales bacterium]|nr:hypothetical protein [Bacteroidales bacterium]
MIKQIFTLIILLSSMITHAQEDLSAGVRMGDLSGFSVRIRDQNMLGAEIIGGWRDGGFTLTGLVQSSRSLHAAGIKQLFFIRGGGAHAGYTQWDGYDNFGWYENNNSCHTPSPVFGLDVMAGIEYHVIHVPLQISLDYKPYMEFYSFQPVRVDLWDIGLSVRYVLNQK